MKNIFQFKKVTMRRLFVFLVLLSSFQTFAQGNCQAGFTYDMTHCPNISFYDNSTSDSAIFCWMYDYNGAGSVDWCEDAHNKFNQNGTYVVCISIMAVDGCMDTWCDTIVIDCNCEKPEAEFIMSQNGNFCQFTDQSILYDIPNTTWLWDFGDGQTSTDQNPTHTYLSDGTFVACLTVSDSCETDMTCMNMIIQVAGFNEIGKDEFSVYPVPANDAVIVAFSGTNSEEATLYVRDLLGNLIMKRSLITEGKQTIDVSDFANGKYILQLIDASGNETHRSITVQH
jgi:PKD repeat protein